MRRIDLARRNRLAKRLGELVEKNKVKAHLKKEKNGRVRKVFRKTPTEDADHFILRQVISRGNRRRFFRVDRRGPAHTIRNYVVQKIFNQLYPQHSIAPLGVGTILVKGKPLTGMFSKIIPHRSRAYREYQRNFYQNKEEAGDHTNFTETKGLPVATQIAIDSGFRVSYKPVNIAESNGQPIFFEIVWVDPTYFQLHLEINGITPETVRSWFKDEPASQQFLIGKTLDALLKSHKRVQIEPEETTFYRPKPN